LNPLLTFSSGITNALQKPLIKTQLHDVISKKDLPHLIKNEGDILIDTEYQNFLKIYTDGSKDPQNNNIVWFLLRFYVFAIKTKLYIILEGNFCRVVIIETTNIKERLCY
jgi:hypothetical protein